MVVAVLLSSSFQQQSKTWAFLLEFLIIVVPVVLNVTVFSPYVTSVVIITGFLIGMHLLIYLLVVFLKQQKPVKRATQVHSTKKDYITNCRATINLLSVIAILAVDFTIFPARFSKTLTTGFSLMDVGVGLFVFANGIVAPEVRGKRDSIGSSIRSSLGLLVIGILRLVLTKLTHYNVSENEYGLHWNFFITLAFTKIFSSCVLSIVQPKYVLVNATLILIAHETLLQLSFKTWVFHHFERDSFIDANKEGLVSAVGYLALYLYSLYFGYIIKHAEKSYRATNGKFLVITMTSLFMTIFCNHHFEVSRRLANAGYVFWVLFIGTFMTWLFYLADHAQKHILGGHTKQSLIYESINYNGLVFFIIGNLLTGLVNLTISTRQVEAPIALLVLFFYMVLNCTALFVFYVKNWKLKL